MVRIVSCIANFAYFQLVGDFEEDEIMARVAFWANLCATAIIMYMEARVNMADKLLQETTYSLLAI